MRRTVGLGITTALAFLLMSGTAQAVKTVSPEAMVFPPTPLGGQSAPQTLTVGIGAEDVSERSTRPLIQDCPDDGCEFKVISTTCPVFPATFPAGASTCTFSIVSAPPRGPVPATGSFERPFRVGVAWPSVTLDGASTAPKKKAKKCKKKGKGKKSAAAAKKKKCGKKKKK